MTMLLENINILKSEKWLDRNGEESSIWKEKTGSGYKVV
jgi:hypothetical protein